MSEVSLETFFAEMAELLAGRRSPAACEQVLGRSRSGTERFGVYAKLVARQHQAALDALYRATFVAAMTWDRERCARLREGFLHDCPPAHWSPVEVAAPFADYLVAHEVPDDLVELADFARTRSDVLRATHHEGLEGLAVRHYTHAVCEFTLAVEREGLAAGRPVPSATTWLLGRHRETAELVLVTPSLAALVALQIVHEGSWSTALPRVPPVEVGQAAERLNAEGLLSRSAVAIVRAAL